MDPDLRLANLLALTWRDPGWRSQDSSTMDTDREAIRLKIRAGIRALAGQVEDKIVAFGVRVIDAIAELADDRAPTAAASEPAAPPFLVTVIPAPVVDHPPRPQAAEPVATPAIPRTPATRQPNGRDMQLTPADPGARTSDGKKLPTCKRCGFYGGNTRGCGRSHRTLPDAKPATYGDDEEPPRDGHACSWLAVPDPDGAVEPPRVLVRSIAADAARPQQAPPTPDHVPAAPHQAAVARTILAAEVVRRVDAIERSASTAPKNLGPPPDEGDGPGTPSTVGRRADGEPTSTGRWAQPGEPLRLGLDKREVCQLHGWVGNATFLRERHDLCEGGEHVAPDAEIADPDDDDSEPAEVAAADDDDEEVPTFIGPHRRRRRNPEAERAKTIPLKKITRADLHDDGVVYASELAELDKIRPRNRSQCVNGLRPCPFMGCRYHLALDVNAETGSIKIAFPDRDLDEMTETCALDVADRGGRTLEGVGALLNVTRERLRQIEYKAVMTLKMSGQADVLLGGEPPVPPDQN